MNLFFDKQRKQLAETTVNTGFMDVFYEENNLHIVNFFGSFYEFSCSKHYL